MQRLAQLHLLTRSIRLLRMRSFCWAVPLLETFLHPCIPGKTGTIVHKTASLAVVAQFDRLSLTEERPEIQRNSEWPHYGWEIGWAPFS